MPGPDDRKRLVVEISRRGKLISGEPYFTAGTPIVLDAKGFGGLERGDLAVVRPGRGRARVEQRIGSAKRIENVLEALLVEQGARVPFEPIRDPGRDPRGPGRPARTAGDDDRSRRRQGLRRRALVPT